MIDLFLRIATGIGLPFSFAAWAGMTLLLLVVGAVLVVVAGPVVEPVAVEIALKPRRVVLWLLLGPVAVAFGVTTFGVTVVGIPIAIFLLLGSMLAAGAGYVAACLVIGHQVMKFAGHELPDWQSAVVGITIVRLLRLVPVAGGIAHAIVVWVGMATALALAWDAALSWHRRRLPDRMQFPDEDLIEWHDEPSDDAR